MGALGPLRLNIPYFLLGTQEMPGTHVINMANFWRYFNTINESHRDLGFNPSDGLCH